MRDNQIHYILVCVFIKFIICSDLTGVQSTISNNAHPVVLGDTENFFNAQHYYPGRPEDFSIGV